MPNLYATPAEIKAEAPDIIQGTTTKYDRALLRLANDVSRLIDLRTGKQFCPSIAAKVLTPEYDIYRLRVPDLIELTTAEYSADSLTYNSLSTAYIVGDVEGDRNSAKSYTHLRLLVNSPLGAWPAIEDGVRITGVWAYADNRSDCWEAASTLSSGVSTGATTLKVSSSAMLDDWGYGASYQAGRLIKVDSEFFEITNTNASLTPNTITVVGARNGSTAAAHSSGATIYIWKPAENVKSACIIEVVKRLNRGLQGYENARATPDMGQPIWEKKLDVQTLDLLSRFMEF